MFPKLHHAEFFAIHQILRAGKPLYNRQMHGGITGHRLRWMEKAGYLIASIGEQGKKFYSVTPAGERAYNTVLRWYREICREVAVERTGML